MTETALFGEVLRYFRAAAGLSQQELSVRSHVAVRTISKLETGVRSAPRLHTVRLLAAALNLDVEQTNRLFAAARPELAHLRPVSPPAAETIPDLLYGGLRNSSLPLPLTSLVGREAIIDEIADTVHTGEARLLTFLGPPGIGKTRVALEVARLLEGDYTQGVIVVWLAPLADASLVLPALAEAVGVSTLTRAPGVDDLIDAVGEAHLLLLLDNMEHVLDVAPIVPELLSRCPRLSVLVTSRTPLQVTGERRVHLPSLPLLGNEDCGVEGQWSKAAQLFVDRARDVEFRVQPSHASLVEEICRRLDGLPLAIELAATQLGSRSLGELAGGLGSILPSLTGGPRDQPERLQTMVRSIEWSYSLLSADEQRLLRWLAVFRGGFDEDAAVAVAAWTPRADQLGCQDTNIRSVLSALVDKNLVTRLSGPGATRRFGLLELIREFAYGLLQETEELAPARQAHARHAMALADQQTWRHWIGRDSGVLDGFADELPNFREALDWYETSQPERMLALASRLLRLWLTSTHACEGRDWLTRGIAATPDASPVERSLAFMALAQTSRYVGDHERAAREYAEALREATLSGDAFMLAWSSIANASMANYRGDFAEGRQMALQAQAVLAQIDEEAQRQAIAAYGPSALGRAEHGLGNLDAAAEHFRQGARQFSENGQMRGAARVVSAWGTLAVEQGDLATALDRFQESVALAEDCGDDVVLATNLRMLAAVMALTGTNEQAVRLQGAIEAFEESAGPLVMATAMDRRVQEQGVAMLQEALSPARIAQKKEEGRSLTLADAARATIRAFPQRSRTATPVIRHRLGS